MHPIDSTSPVSPSNNPEHFETDTQKLMHRHLHDKDHVISEEELKSLRVGMAPTPAFVENLPLNNSTGIDSNSNI